MTLERAADLGRLSRRAAELAQAGKHDDAVLMWEQLNRSAPGNAGVAAGLGAALLGADRKEDALDWLGAACRQHSGNAMLLRLHAQAMIRLGHRGPAIGALYMSLEMEPGSVQAHADLGNALYLERSSAAALPHAEFAFRANPSEATGATLTSVLLELGRTDEALAVVQRAMQAGAERPPMLVLQSLALQTVRRDAEALAAAREAVEGAPESAIARHNLSALLLLHGYLTPEAWGLYESRSGLLEMRTWPGAQRRWNGGEITGRTLLLHAEQGLGDTLQFVRYVPMVAARGARVVLAVQSALVRLLQGTPGADLVVAGGAGIPPFDLYCPLLSLPGVFGTTLDTIPEPLPLTAAPGPARRRGTLRVGLVWAGNPNFLDDRRRSVDPALLAPLGKVPGVTLHSLQFGADDLPVPGMDDLMRGVTDFADTAARIAGLDLVIAVDTSVAHLAATMGKPVWLLSRFHGCWRWMLEREDTLWYPSMRIYRQPRLNDWKGVIDRVCDDLGLLASGFEPARTMAA